MDVQFLRPLFDRRGPWASVYLDATRSVENADRQVDLRWRALRDRLAGQGADEGTLNAIDSALRDQPYQPGQYGLAVFAQAGEIVMVEPLPAPPPSDEARYEALPHAMPLLAQRGEEVSYVRVLADRTGADLEGLAVGRAPRRRTVEGGEDFPLRKVRVGGWSHRRYQRAAEESWERNAGDMAAAAVDLAESVGAEVIVLGGDVRAVQTFVEQLPRRWQDRVVRTDAGSRRAGADHDALDDVTVQAIADVAARHVRETIDRYRAQRGDHAAATGLVDLVSTLQRGQVDTVLLVNDSSSTDTLWIGPDDPSLIAVDEETLRDAGVQEPQKVRADAALLRAIVGTGARLVLVGPGEAPLEHGVGAVLRYADASTAASS
ncbi:ROK family protein [Plantactinospora sp. ZYX-F-223]|uniref:baeRF2 domain-containing protein n=1 Tax=Plantactinospora sp. ZYX-F-223 TaxID=3144103 RepID=UPI0031FD7634